MTLSFLWKYYPSSKPNCLSVYNCEVIDGGIPPWSEKTKMPGQYRGNYLIEVSKSFNIRPPKFNVIYSTKSSYFMVLSFFMNYLEVGKIDNL